MTMTVSSSRLPGGAMNPAVIDDPQVLAEVGAVFQAYEAALMGNDLAALNGFFWADARVTRYGIADRQWGIKALIAFRAATAAPMRARSGKSDVNSSRRISMPAPPASATTSMKWLCPNCLTLLAP